MARPLDVVLSNPRTMRRSRAWAMRDNYNAPEEALEALSRVEDPESPVRVIIAVRVDGHR